MISSVERLLAETEAKGQERLDAISERAARLRFGVHTGAVAETVRRLIDREPSDREHRCFEGFLDALVEGSR